MQQQLKHKIHSDMPALLPNPVVNFHTQTLDQGHISPYAKVDEVFHLKNQNITKRSLGDIVKIVSGIVKGASIVGNIISGARLVGGMIIDGINTVINYKKAKAMSAATHTLNRRSFMNNEQIIRVRNHLLHVSKVSLADIKGNRDNLYRFDKELDRLYSYSGLVHNATMEQFYTQFRETINMATNLRYLSGMLKFYMAHVEMQMHEYQDLTQIINHFFDGLQSILDDYLLH